jgi:hypothetical protein
MPRMDIKVEYNDITRKLSVYHRQDPPAWEEIADPIKKRFEVPADFPIAYEYYDEDGDTIRM